YSFRVIDKPALYRAGFFVPSDIRFMIKLYGKSFDTGTANRTVFFSSIAGNFAQKSQITLRKVANLLYDFSHR
ncbi:hypothetical protein, partial [Agrobacterium vitis]|uniref:hypothetical protein n=1 Tax=Agrobacterium vitis TaxID=373 RepID=UPI001AEF098E